MRDERDETFWQKIFFSCDERDMGAGGTVALLAGGLLPLRGTITLPA